MSEWIPALGEGLWITAQATVLGFLVAVAISFVVGVAYEVRFWPLRALLRIYVEVFRGTSALVQIFYFFYVLPLLGIHLSPLAAGVLALGMNFGAYGAEIVRGAIAGVARGQREASLALGMSRPLALRRIILPQAIPAMIPPFGNIAVDLMKATALLSLITVSDLAFVGAKILQADADPIRAYLPVLVLYFVLAICLGRLTRVAERLVTVR